MSEPRRAAGGGGGGGWDALGLVVDLLDAFDLSQGDRVEDCVLADPGEGEDVLAPDDPPGMPKPGRAR